MANKFGLLEAGQGLADRPVRFIKRSHALSMVRRGAARRVGPYLLQLVLLRAATAEVAAAIADSAEWERAVGRSIGRSNLIPFAKVQNPLMHPEKLHYPVPACGARDRRTSAYQTNYLPPEMQRSARA
jgi:hypothetical protein